MKGTVPATGAATQHPLNKQNGSGKGVTNVPLKKSMANKNPPNIKDANPASSAVKMAPKINAEAGGKRVVQGEAKPNKHVSTFTAPRTSGGGGGVTDLGYTKLGKA